MEKPVLEAITYIFNIPTNQKVPLIQQTVSVLGVFINIASRFFAASLSIRKYEINQINIMQLSFIALSLLFCLVSDSYKFSVKIVL